jgi:3-hydroxypropanoate dehydrogenase
MSSALPDASLDQLFRMARTYNGYLDQPVSTEQLHALWDLMKMAPTSANQLPARLVWVTTDEAKAKLAACTMPANGAKILSAPVSVIVAMDMQFHEQLPWLFPHADAKAWFVGNDALREKSAFLNTTLQAGYFIMAARALCRSAGLQVGDALDAGLWRPHQYLRSQPAA